MTRPVVAGSLACGVRACRSGTGLVDGVERSFGSPPEPAEPGLLGYLADRRLPGLSVIIWQLAEAGAGTSITVNVSLPEREAGQLDWQHDVIEESLRRLTALAEAAV
jgi:hypothetical protein